MQGRPQRGAPSLPLHFRVENLAAWMLENCSVKEGWHQVTVLGRQGLDCEECGLL